MPRHHSPPCTCGARHWLLQSAVTDGEWVGYCADCGTERRWPARPDEGHPLKRYKDPTAHAPTQYSQIWVAGSRDTRTVY